MAVKTVFTDGNNNEMDCYLNDNGEVFINVGPRGEDVHYSGYITLDKEDVQQLIKLLSELEKEMPELG